MNRYRLWSLRLAGTFSILMLLFACPPIVVAQSTDTISADPSPGTAHSAVQFTANIDVTKAEVWDSQGNEVTPTSYTYSWTFGDDSTDTTSTNTTSHTYTSSGTFNVDCSLSASAGLEGETNNSVPATQLSLTIDDSSDLTITAPDNVSEGETISISATGVATGVSITVTPDPGYTLLSGSLTGTDSVSATIKYAAAGTYEVQATADGYADTSATVAVHSFTTSGTYAPYQHTETLSIDSDSDQVTSSFDLTINDTAILVFGSDETGTGTTTLNMAGGTVTTTIYATGIGATTITVTPQ